MNSKTRSAPAQPADQARTRWWGCREHLSDSLGQHRERARRNVTVLGRSHHVPNHPNLMRCEPVWRATRTG